MTGRFRFSTRWLILAVALLGFDLAAMTRAIQVRNPGGFRPQVFPYSGRMLKIFSVYRRFFHPRG